MFNLKFTFLSVYLTLFSFGTLLGLVGYYATDTAIGFNLFKVSYTLCPFKRSFLEFYSPAQRNHGVNTRSESNVNAFLVERIEATQDKNEISAIVHYFTFQSQTPVYDIFVNASDESKPLIVEQLINELDSNPLRLRDEIMILETTRTGKRIGKGSIHIEGENKDDYPPDLSLQERGKIFDEHLARTNASQKYHDWWNLNLSWEEKKKINPLESTGIKVSYCCG